MTAAKRTDRELLGQIEETSKSAESAFEQLVLRHSQMVLNVCRRCLHNASDADDVAQATFLVLWRKADRLGRYESVAGWLHRVAQNICQNKNRSQQARRERERKVARMKGNVSSKPIWDDLRELLDAELDHLPEKYRLPLILRYLEGHEVREVADLIGLNASTVRTRLSRALAMLRTRLSKRGVVIGSSTLIVTLDSAARSSHVSDQFIAATSSIPKAALSPNVVLLANGAIQVMTYKTIATAVCVVLALVVSINAIYFARSPIQNIVFRSSRMKAASFAEGNGVIVPFTSELQRLASPKFKDADVLVLVNGRDLFRGVSHPTQERVDGFDYSVIERDLSTQLGDAKDAIVVFNVLWPSSKNQSLVAAQVLQGHLIQLAEPFCKEARLGRVDIPAADNSLAWDIPILLKEPTKGDIRKESKSGKGQVNVFVTSTALSQYLYGNADCVVNVVPLLEQTSIDLGDEMEAIIANLGLTTKEKACLLYYTKNHSKSTQQLKLLGDDQFWCDRLGFATWAMQMRY